MSSNSGDDIPLLQIFARLVQTPAAVLDSKLSLHPDAPRIVVLGPLPGYTSCMCIGQREKSVLKGEVRVSTVAAAVASHTYIHTYIHTHIHIHIHIHTHIHIFLDTHIHTPHMSNFF